MAWSSEARKVRMANAWASLIRVSWAKRSAKRLFDWSWGIDGGYPCGNGSSQKCITLLGSRHVGDELSEISHLGVLTAGLKLSSSGLASATPCTWRGPLFVQFSDQKTGALPFVACRCYVWLQHQSLGRGESSAVSAAGVHIHVAMNWTGFVGARNSHPSQLCVAWQQLTSNDCGACSALYWGALSFDLFGSEYDYIRILSVRAASYDCSSKLTIFILILIR